MRKAIILLFLLLSFVELFGQRRTRPRTRALWPADQEGQFIIADGLLNGEWNNSVIWDGSNLLLNGDTVAVLPFPVATIDTFEIDSDLLYISLTGDGIPALTVDLTPYLNTDNQTVDTFSLDGTILTLAIEDDGESPYTVDLSSLGGGGGTDDQILSWVLGTTTLSIEDGNSVDLSGLLDNTDDQTVDLFQLTGTTLELSLESDGQAPYTVDLSSLSGGGTDDQTLTIDSSGATVPRVFTIGIEDGNSISFLDLGGGGADGNGIFDVNNDGGYVPGNYQVEVDTIIQFGDIDQSSNNVYLEIDNQSGEIRIDKSDGGDFAIVYDGVNNIMRLGNEGGSNPLVTIYDPVGADNGQITLDASNIQHADGANLRYFFPKLPDSLYNIDTAIWMIPGTYTPPHQSQWVRLQDFRTLVGDGTGTDSQTLSWAQSTGLLSILNGNNITIEVMTGATDVADGEIGLVPKAVAGQDTMVLFGDGQWKAISAAVDGDDWGSQSAETDATISGNGLLGNELSIAQQGAAPGEILKWTGSTWAPDTDETGGSMDSWFLDGNSGTPQEISEGNTVTIVGTGSITTTALSTDSLIVDWTSDIDSLENVLITSPTVNQVLVYNGGLWVNGTDQVNDADSNPSNEIQSISLDSTGIGGSLRVFEIGISSGNNIYFNESDDQTVDTFSFSGTTLTLALEDDGESPYTVDLSSLQDGTGTDDQILSWTLGTTTLAIESGNSVNLSGLLDNTDDQQVSTFSLSTNILTLELESDGQAPHTVDLSEYLDNTDSQTLTWNGTSQIIGISGGNTQDLTEGIQDASLGVIIGGTDITYTYDDASNTATIDWSGTDSDNQTLSYNSSTDEITISGGNTIDITEVDTDTDEQTIDTFQLNGTVLELSIESDGELFKSVDLISLRDGTGTDDQTLSYNPGNQTLSIESGNTIDLSGLLDNTDNQTLSWSDVGNQLSISDGNIVLITGFMEAFDIDGDSGSSTISDGTTFTITGGTNITTDVTADNVTIDWAGALNDLSNVTEGSPSAGQVLEFNGSIWTAADDDVGASEGIRDTIEIKGHGFTKSEMPIPLYVDNYGGWNISDNSTEERMHDAFVVDSINVDLLVIQTEGPFETFSNHSYLKGRNYFLTDTPQTYDTLTASGELNDWLWTVYDSTKLILKASRPYDPSSSLFSGNGIFNISNDGDTVPTDFLVRILDSITWEGDFYINSGNSFLDVGTASGSGTTVDNHNGFDGVSMGWGNGSYNTLLEFGDRSSIGAGGATPQVILSIANEPLDQYAFFNMRDNTAGSQISIVQRAFSISDNNMAAGVTYMVDYGLNESFSAINAEGDGVGEYNLYAFNDNDTPANSSVSIRAENLATGFLTGYWSFIDRVEMRDDNATFFTGTSSLVTMGSYGFDIDQTVGAGQDDFVLTYNNSTGLISLESAGGGGSDDQQVTNFSISSNTLTLEIEDDGQAPHTVSLAPYLDNTDSQTLSIVESTRVLSISNGNNVDLSESIQEEVNALLVAGAGINLTYSDVGNTLTIASTITDTDDQTLTWTDGTNTLEILDGNSVVITGFADNNHASTHIRNGSDEIDADQLEINYGETNYTPTTTPSEVSHVNHLTAHLAGIDDKLGDVEVAAFDSQVSGTIDLLSRGNYSREIDMTGLSSITIVLNNPVDGGAYIIWFSDADNGDTVNWPAAVIFEGGGAMGTDALSGGRRKFDLLYNGTNYIVSGGY